MRCHCPRRPAPAAMRRNMASLMAHVGRRPQGLEDLLHARRGGARKQRLRGRACPRRPSCRPGPAGSWAPEARSCCSLSVAGPGSPGGRPETPSPHLGLLQRLRYAAETGAGILVDGLDGSPAGVGHVSYGFFGPRWACQASTSSSRAWKLLHTPQSTLVR